MYGRQRGNHSKDIAKYFIFLLIQAKLASIENLFEKIQEKTWSFDAASLALNFCWKYQVEQELAELLTTQFIRSLGLITVVS